MLSLLFLIVYRFCQISQLFNNPKPHHVVLIVGMLRPLESQKLISAVSPAWRASSQHEKAFNAAMWSEYLLPAKLRLDENFNVKYEF